MKKSLTIIGGIIIICLIVFSSFKSCYNEMVAEQEKATTAWSNVQSAYQRRADLIPNLVETVKGYAKHEEGTLTEVINARSKATQVTVDPANLTPEKVAGVPEGTGRPVVGSRQTACHPGSLSRPEGQRELQGPAGAA